MIDKMERGTRVRFAEEKQAYTVRAIGPRFAVCTKPFNPRHTVLYTVIDFEEKIRGTEGVVLGLGAETDEDCEEMLQRLESVETEISHRNRIPLVFAERQPR
jgi:hypothetical protein